MKLFITVEIEDEDKENECEMHRRINHIISDATFSMNTMKIPTQVKITNMERQKK